MPIVEPKTLHIHLRPGQRVMGLDLGSKTIGVAISDPTLVIASPVEVIQRSRFKADAEKLIRLIGEHRVGAVVLGLPINMNGSEGPRCQSTRQFAANLLQEVDLPIAFWDERLSTAAVERMMRDEADLSRARRAQNVDKLAAGYILQGAIDHVRANATMC